MAETQRVTPLGRSRDWRPQIVDAAAHLFDASGYHATTMDDLAASVGLAKGSLYHYFSGKDEILFEISSLLINLLVERQEARVAARLTPSQMLLEIITDILEVIDSHRGYVRVYFEYSRHLPPDKQAVLSERQDHYQRMVQEAIGHAIDEGECRPVDIRFTALALFGMCNWAYTWYDPAGPKRPREIAYVLWDLINRGVEARDR